MEGSIVYTYRKNLFGDIVAIYQDATKVAEYAYDAWGKCTIVTDTNNVAANNPFRYRSYYWDNDLQLYYLMSRYYDPQIGRFINADSLEYIDPETLGGLNLYAYCGNNPVMGIDPEGNLDWKRIGRGLLVIFAAIATVAVTVATLGTGSVLGGVIISGTIGAAGELFSQTVIENKSFKEVDYWQVAVSGIAGATSAVPGVGFGGSVIISGVNGFFNDLIGGASFIDAFVSGLKSAGITALAGGITRSIGLGKIFKIGKQNYASKKIFLNRVGSTKLAQSLSCFNPAINKSHSLIGFIYGQVGLKGLSQLANDTAGAFINTISNIITSLFV